MAPMSMTEAWHRVEPEGAVVARPPPATAPRVADPAHLLDVRDPVGMRQAVWNRGCRLRSQSDNCQQRRWPLFSSPTIASHYSGKGNVGTNFYQRRSMERSHRPPFTTAPVADSQRSSDPCYSPLALVRIAKGDGCHPPRTDIFECDGRPTRCGADHGDRCRDAGSGRALSCNAAGSGGNKLKASHRRHILG
jgi:hypothetical protein